MVENIFKEKYAELNTSEKEIFKLINKGDFSFRTDPLLIPFIPGVKNFIEETIVGSGLLFEQVEQLVIEVDQEGVIK